MGKVIFFEQLIGLVVAEVGANGATELIVFFLEESNGLLKRFEKELFADPGSFGMFSVTFSVEIGIDDFA